MRSRAGYNEPSSRLADRRDVRGGETSSVPESSRWISSKASNVSSVADSRKSRPGQAVACTTKDQSYAGLTVSAASDGRVVSLCDVGKASCISLASASGQSKARRQGMDRLTRCAWAKVGGCLLWISCEMCQLGTSVQPSWSAVKGNGHRQYWDSLALTV